jgi:hypothetical protein
MSLITDTWQQLVRRRLWPVALGLLAALAAVPLLLAREPDVQPVAATAPATTVAGTGMTEPVIALDDEGADEGRRRVLGARKDPFAAAPVARKKRSAKSASATQAATSEPAATSSSDVSSGGSSASGGPTTTTVESSTPPSTTAPKTVAKKKTYPRYSATVRFGEDDSPGRRVVEPMQALPSKDNPVAVYLGVSGDGRRAVFMLDAGTTTEGDATCDPSPEECETIELSPGESEFITVTGDDGEVAEYTLDVVKIHRATASASSTPTAESSSDLQAGRRALRARASSGEPLGYRLDARTGTAKRLRRSTFSSAAVAAAQAAAQRAS